MSSRELAGDSGAEQAIAEQYQDALRSLGAGRYLDATRSCERALALDPQHADSLHLMGLISLRTLQFDAAVEWLARAIRQAPKAKYLASLGIALRQQGRLEEALRTFDKAVQLDPNDAELWKRLGSALVDVGRPDDAVLSFQHALKLNPCDPDAAWQSGLILYKSKRLEDALANLDLCDELQANNVGVLFMRALVRHGLRQFEECLSDNLRARELDPANPEICNNISHVLQSLRRYEESLVWADRALGLKYDLLPALENKALSLTQLHRFREAAAVYRRLKELDPGHAKSDFGCGILHLLTGDFALGWAEREARWKVPGIPIVYPNNLRPMWLGDESIANKTILVYAEEGMGDALQFVRYVPMLAARGARVVLVVHDPLQALLSGVSGVAHCLPRSVGALPPFDVHCAITSLPLAFRTRLDTIPAEVPYLPAPPESQVQAWEGRLGRHDRLRVGLVWSGNADHEDDHNRSIPLQTLTRILDVDATFVSLQKDPRSADRAVLSQRTDIIDLTAELTDFSETAALVSCLDLVISVDTSVAHLAGALGKPTWVMLPYLPDFRWLLDREDSPWYPSVKLFRQDETRDYGSVLDRMRTALADLIAGRVAGPSAANGGR